MRFTSLILTLCLAALLGGCAQMSNRVYCSADQKDLVYVSWYARLGVGAKVDDKDARALCARQGAPATP